MSEAREITVGGVRLAYRESGDLAAPPLVLLHGLGEDSTGWDEVAAAFGDRFRVLAVDLRGHGHSGRPGTYSLSLMRDDVLGLLGELGLAQITLMGHSLGGAVAFLAAEARPDLVGRLIVEDVTPTFRRDQPLPERPDGPLGFDWDMVVAMLTEINQGDEVAWQQLSTITAPTLIVGGGPDSHIPAQKLADAVARLPHGELVTIPAGHYVHNRRPAEFIAAVREWLERLPGPGGSGLSGHRRRRPAAGRSGPGWGAGWRS
ncbi:MAG TPA: alpha/beta hydrolase [Streptosporangiaceae bacterium]